MNTYAGKQWMGHPRGLATLFFTEMWERFSYYGMRALLILYMVAPVAQGGLGMPTEKGAAVYGWYVFAVYAASIPGGWLADRFFGLYHAVLFGGIIIALGHFCMAFPAVETFYLGLALIVIGTGLLKPNVSSIVGTLYDEKDQRRDSGFSIFYMGINLGAFIAPLVCGWLGQKVNWHWGFAAAGFGMTAGVIQYVAGRKYLESARSRHARETNEELVAEKTEHKAFTSEEWKRIAVIGILFLFATMFWGAFEQAGSSLTLFADRNTSTSLLGYEFPSSWFQSVQPLFIIILSGVFAWFWLKLGRHEPSSPMKFVFGLVFVGLGFLLLVPAASISQSHGIRISPMWLVGAYLLHTIGELCLSPVGLSTVTKLAPPRIVGFMMGIWFMSISLGGKLGAWVAGFFDRFPLPSLFGAVAATTIGAGLILITLVPTIRKLMGGVH